MKAIPDVVIIEPKVHGDSRDKIMNQKALHAQTKLVISGRVLDILQLLENM